MPRIALFTVEEERIHHRRWGENGDGPDSHTPAHESITTVAPFRAWPGSLSIVAGGPPGPPQRLQQAAEGAYCAAIQLALQAVKASLPTLDPLGLAERLWALAHGLAVVNINGHLPLFLPHSDVGDMLCSSTHAFLDGVEASQKRQ